MNNKERIAISKKNGTVYQIDHIDSYFYSLKANNGETFKGYPEEFEIRYLHHPMYGKEVEVCAYGFTPPSWVKVILIDAGPDWIQYTHPDDEGRFRDDRSSHPKLFDGIKGGRGVK